MQSPPFSPEETLQARAFWALAPLIFVVLWAGGYGFARLGLGYVEPMTMLSLRYGLAVLVLLPVVLWRRPVWPKAPGHWAAVALTGFLLHGVYFGLAYLAMKQGMTAGTTAIIMALQPALVAALAPLLGIAGQGGRLLWLGLALGFAGVAVTVAASIAGTGGVVAILLALCALAGITCATLFEKWQGRKTDPVAAGVIQYVTGFAVLFPVAAATESMVIDWQPGLIVALAYLVVANSLISISLYIAMLARGDATRVSAQMYLVPPLAIIMAWLLLGEVLTPFAIVGLMLAAAGVFVVNRQTG